MATDHRELESAQRWMLAAITHPGGVRAGLRTAGEGAPADALAPGGAIGPVDPLSPEARLEIYADLHRARVVEVLARDFPIVERTLGERAFAELAAGYAAAHPPRSWRLAELGAHFPAFLADVAAIAAPLRPFLADLARLERAVDEVFDEEESLAFDAGTLRGLDWERARLEPVAALRLLALDHPVNRYYDAALAGARPAIPGRSPRRLVIWRRDFTVWRAEIDLWQHTMLAALVAGHTLGEAIESCLAVPGVAPAELQSELAGWFASWTADGLFSRVA